ncbi:MAG: hypothetical protein ACYDER_14780 [Ktedonobacteraceae bacterium]
MRRRLLALTFCIMLLGMIVLCSNIFIVPPTSFAAAKAQLSLNLSAGPLGVALTLKGMNFPQGQVTFSYIDPQNVPGTFMVPGDENAQVQSDGTFVTTNLIMPASGPIGVWKILVTDSAGIIWSIHYTALAAPGEQTAGAPTLTVNPTSGQGGDSIAFTGSNWLPGGTHVNLMLLMGTTLLPLFDTPVVADKNGKISGNFHLPVSLDVSQVTVTASDIATGALRAQTTLTVGTTTPAPTTSATPTTPVASATPITIVTPTGTASHTILPPVGSDSARGPLSPSLKLVLGLPLLIASGLLVIIALLMILYWLPRSGRKQG